MTPVPRALEDLRSDCSQCAGLCCVVPAFDKGDDFALDKAAHAPCPNLDNSNACRIHETLSADGFAGCIQFECHGAGQYVVQTLHNGSDWRDAPGRLAHMADDFTRLRPVFEQLALLHLAQNLPLTKVLHAQREAMIARLQPEKQSDPI